jgi:hypothetical protein
MRLVKKITLITGSLLLLAILLPGLYAFLRQDKVTAALIRKVNESVDTRISYGGVRLTIFESFPNITARFSNLLVEPSPFYDKKQFGKENNDTLLFTSSLSLTVSMPSLLTGTVSVKSITARDGEVNLLTDRRGDINFMVLPEKKGDGKNVRLRNISAVNIRAVYNDRSSDMRIAGTVGEATLGGELFRTGIYLNTVLKAQIDSLSLNGNTIRGFPAEAGVKLRKSASSLSVAKGSLTVADLRFDISGNINYSASTLNLAIDGRKISIASVISRLPEKWKNYTGTFSPAGILDIKCSITGPYGEAGKPHIELIYGLTNGKMSHSASGFKVNNLEFRGEISNGDHNSAETFRITVDNLTARYGSASVEGSFMMNNLRRPHITLALSGDLDFNDLSRIFRSGYIRDQTGFVSGSIRMAGTVPDSTGIVSALPYLKPEVSLLFREFGATVADRGLSFSGVNGALSINNDLVTENLALTFRDQRFTLNTVMKNFVPWLAGSSVQPAITGEIHADRLATSSFARDKEKDRDSDTLRSYRKSPDLFPSDITANLRLRADSLIVNKFRASGVTTRLIYKPYVITLEEARAEGLDGVLAGEFMLGRQKEGGYISRVRLDVSDIDINKAFTAFNNFGQDFIVSDNLQGRLTGNVTVLSPHDGNYRIMRKAIAAEAHLLISEGKLISFAPAESLSSYLDLSELKNISFSRMENDLFINNGTVSIPKMLINSTAVNFTVYGTHGFDGDYSYHVRLLLSEVMSRKARERNRGVSSFGQVKVDGSGKATVPLKIVCISGKTNVSYDFGQAQENIKSDIAVEKQTLKGILNEEYGWYETDTARIRPAESKPKFSVTWEEGKEQPATTESPKEEVKESPIKILLKKKK